VEWLAEVEAPARREDFSLYLGASELAVHVRILSPALESSSITKQTLVELHLAEPALTLPGDRFVLRRPSPSQTIGGGFVIDPFPRKRLSRAKTIDRLERLLASEFAGRIELLVEEKVQGHTLQELVSLTGQSPQVLKDAVKHSQRLFLIDNERRVISESRLIDHRQKLIRWLNAFHVGHPSVSGAPVAQARLGLDAALANFLFAHSPEVKVSGDLIALTVHRPQISQQESAALDRLEQVFREAGYQPSNALELIKASGVRSKDDRALLEKLIKAGKLVRVSETLVFHADVLAHIRNSLARHKGRRFSVPEFKDWTQISRKHAIPLLEYLDHQHVTRRDGDSRVVL
jgi:selenocysteine-specific elongation factor